MPVNLHTTLRPDARGWGSGWPNCQSDKWEPVGKVDGTQASFGSGRREVVPLVRLLIAETARRGYVFHPHPQQCWGAVCREIRDSNPKVPSNHSWGLAFDFNSVYNFLGRADGGDVPKWMVALWNHYGFRWGGDYTDRKDPMHFEFMGSQADAKHLHDEARKNLGGGDDVPLSDKQEEAIEFAIGVQMAAEGGPEPQEAGPRRRGYRWAKRLAGATEEP